MSQMAGCFGATSSVVVISGQDERVVTEVQHLRKGDVVEVEGDSTAKVICVMVADMQPSEQLVSIPGGPTLTRHHPVRVRGDWRAPEGLGPTVPVGYVRTVYNFVLDRVHVMMVDGYPCVTLGHGLAGQHVAHAFYGTHRCIGALAALDGWEEGLVHVRETLRDDDGHACGFVAAPVAAPAPEVAVPEPALSSPVEHSTSPAARPVHPDLCAVCMSSPATHAIVPCGHQCGCLACLDHVRFGGDPRCPICRVGISGVVRVIASGVHDDDDDDGNTAGAAVASTSSITNALPNLAIGAAAAAAAAAAGPSSTETVSTPLPFQITSDAHHAPLSVTVSASGSEGPVDVLVRISCPETTGTRSGADIAIAIDVSGSMGTDATYEDEQGNVRTDGLSVLCIAQRAVRVVIASLTAGDRLAIVAFDQAATLVLPLTMMNTEGRAAAEAAVSKLRHHGQTNIWAGLQSAMDALNAGAESAASAGRQQTVLLLTDGQPNVLPPAYSKLPAAESHVAALKDYAAQKGSLPTIRTFGFGYDLASKLLLDVARVGGGTFAFIPVTPVMGTVFVHAIANTLSMYVPTATVSLTACGGATFELPRGNVTEVNLPGGVLGKVAPWGLSVPAGPLQCGSTRDVLVRMVLPPNYGGDVSRFVNVTVECSDGARATAHGTVGEDDRPPTIAALRALVVTEGFAAMKEADAEHMDAAHRIIDSLIAKINDSAVAGDEHVTALRKDVMGRVKKSLDGAPRYKRWGRHYLRALLRAYEVQQCTNVLDFALQSFGGSLFSELREHGNKLFLALPPPQAPTPECPLCHRSFTRATIEAHAAQCFGAPPPQAAGRPQSAARTAAYTAPVRPPSPIDVNNYTTGGGGCFSATSTVVVLSSNGARRATEVQHVKRGDLIAVAGDKFARVRCVVRIAMPADAELVSIPGGPTLTPTHPVCVDGKWRAPMALGVLVPVGSSRAVYNFVLESSHVLLVDGYQCITLGHGMTTAGVAHSFYGSQRVVNSLAVLHGWADGYVDVAKTLRDSNGHAIGFIGAATADEGAFSMPQQLGCSALSVQNLVTVVG